MDKVGKYVFDTVQDAEAYIVELKANGDTRNLYVVDDGRCAGVFERTSDTVWEQQIEKARESQALRQLLESLAF